MERRTIELRGPEYLLGICVVTALAAILCGLGDVTRAIGAGADHIATAIDRNTATCRAVGE
jgi:hypothetical protein